MPPWAPPFSTISWTGVSVTVWSHVRKDPAPACSESHNGGPESRRCLRGIMPPVSASKLPTQCWSTHSSPVGLQCAPAPSSLTEQLSAWLLWLVAIRDWGSRHTACLLQWGHTGSLRGCFPCAHIAIRLAAWIRSQGFPLFTSSPRSAHFSLPPTPYVGSGM